MPVNLKGAERAVADLMEDEIRIERMPRDAERTLNPATGQYDEPARIILYEGPGFIGTNAQEPRPRERGGVIVDETLYYVRWPKEDTTRIRRDDRVVSVTCERDPEMEGLEFRVEQELHSSFSVSRRCHLTLVDHVVD